MNLNPEQTKQLLQAVGAMDGGTLAMFGWSLGDDGLQTSTQTVATYNQLPTVAVPASGGLLITESYSYSNTASNLQRKFSSSGSFSVGIPDIFNSDSSYSVSTVAETISDTTTVHFQMSIVVQMQEIKFGDGALTLQPGFVQEVENALAIAQGGDTAGGAVQLLEKMASTWGQFVPSRIIVGGRIALSSSMEVSDLTQIENIKRDFKTAANATIVLEELPIDLGSTYNLEWANSQEVKQVTRQWNITTDVVGGDLSQFGASDRPTAQDVTVNKQSYQNWIASLNNPELWRVIAFGDRSLTPVIGLLDADTNQQVQTVLRFYFRTQLYQQDTRSAGYRHDIDFGPEQIGDIEGPQKVHMFWGNDVCQVRITYLNFDGVATEYPTDPNAMRRQYGDYRTYVNFNPGDQFKALDIWKLPGQPFHGNDDLIQRVRFIMTSGAEYPAQDSYYGSNPGATVHVYLEAPRVRAVVGSFDNVVHELRLRYLQLSNLAATRDYLLAIEPYLFPNGNYREITQLT